MASFLSSRFLIAAFELAPPTVDVSDSLAVSPTGPTLPAPA